MTDIPGPCLTEAMASGLTETTVLTEWTKYAQWSIENYPDFDLGGRSWRRWVKHVLDDAKLPKLTSPELARAERKAEEQRRVALEGAAYDRGAMTFQDWCRLTLRKVERLEEVSAHDLKVARWWQAQKDPSAGFGTYLASLGLTL
jgi:hypothetical protein